MKIVGQKCRLHGVLIKSLFLKFYFKTFLKRKMNFEKKLSKLRTDLLRIESLLEKEEWTPSDHYSKKLLSLEKEIIEVSIQLCVVELYLRKPSKDWTDQDTDKFISKEYLIDEKKRLGKKEEQLRDEKAQLIKEKERLSKKEDQLREEKKQKQCKSFYKINAC
jgi:hypothetical protein